MISEIAMRDLMAQEMSHDTTWEVELRNVLRQHSTREGTALLAYQALAAAAADPGVRYLADVIVKDEQQHHTMIADMLRRVESDLSEVDMQPSVPGAVMPGADFFDATASLLELEKEDERELHRLRRMMRKEPESSLLPLIVDLLLLDTSKHIEILRFIRDHA